jgi:hypothetical protein
MNGDENVKEKNVDEQDKIGTSQVFIYLFNFFFLQQANLIGPSHKKMKLWRLPNIEGSILKYRVPLLWPTYISERRTTFGKAYRIKVRCYGEHVGNTLGTWGT